MTEALTNLSQNMADVVESAGKSVVRVEGRRRLSASGIVWSADGLVLTAHHVVRREEGIKIGFPDGNSVTATMIGRDPTTDLALLRAETEGLTPPELQEPASLSVGHLVLALGRPGKTVQATLGIVSALGESWRTPAGGPIDRYLQTDVVMYPGFSGGPLVTTSGKIAGLNTSGLLRGVSLTVPTPTLKRVAATLLEHGRMRRGYLGIGAQPVRLPEGAAAKLERETGLLLISVEPDSPADKAGLVLGDTIFSYDDQPIGQLDDLLTLLSAAEIGTLVTLHILRGGKPEEVAVVLGESS
jgi:S1-C subfamily serine protease